MMLETKPNRLGLIRLWPRIVLLLGLGLLSFLQPACAEAPSQVVVVLSDSAPAYREVADAFIAALAGKYPVRIRLLGEMHDSEISELRLERGLMVPVGVRAMRELSGASGRRTSMLSLLVPRTASRSLADTGQRNSAVFIDQPLGRSLAFVKLLLPKIKKVGVIVSSETVGDLRSLASETARSKLELITETIQTQTEVPSALQRLLPQVDVLLLVQDAEVVNENTVRHILIASYRQRKPVIGFSRGLTNAGAVASLVSSPSGIGREGGLLARQWNPSTGGLPAAKYTSEFELVFNRQVARSIDIDVPTKEQERTTWRPQLEQ